MAHRFEKGKSIYFLFKNGYTVQDSQLKPRYYLEHKKAKEYLPYGDEIVEYAPVVHGEWIAVPNSGIGNTAKCSCCGKCIYGYKAINYCPNCGADMRERKGDDA